MADLVKKITTGAICLGLFALTALPLNAQKHATDYFEKAKMSHCISKRGIKHNSYYFKKEKEDYHCMASSKKNKSYDPKRDKDEGYCVENQEKRYSRHAPKINTNKR